MSYKAKMKLAKLRHQQTLTSDETYPKQTPIP